MTKPGKDRDMEATERPAHDPVRPAQTPDMPHFSEALSLNPLLAHPVAAMAAATAIGFGFANQMASAFFGVMQGALETANRHRAAEAAEAAPAKAEAPAVAEPVKAPEAVAVAVEVAQAPPLPKAPSALEIKTAPKPVAAKKTAVKVEPAVAPAKIAPVQKPKVKAAPKALAKVAPEVRAKSAPEAVAKAEPKATTKAPVKAKASSKPTTEAGDGDLKKISGIGPKLEGLLKDMGVANVAQIAAWTNKDIARFDKELGFEGRIVRDDWVGQAKALLK